MNNIVQKMWIKLGVSLWFSCEKNCGILTFIQECFKILWESSVFTQAFPKFYKFLYTGKWGNSSLSVRRLYTFST